MRIALPFLPVALIGLVATPGAQPPARRRRTRFSPTRVWLSDPDGIILKMEGAKPGGKPFTVMEVKQHRVRRRPAWRVAGCRQRTTDPRSGPEQTRSPGVSSRRRAQPSASAPCCRARRAAGSRAARPAGPATRSSASAADRRCTSSAVNQTFAEHAELVACCDVNAGPPRAGAGGGRQAAGRPAPALYAAARLRPDGRGDEAGVVIVTTPCGIHHQYICRAMELGVDVITEKPMTVDAEKCQRILDTQRRTGRTCRVTFNYRYSPPRTQVKDLLMSGVIGDVLSVDFHWMLNTHHGADYFRRWHSQQEDLRRPDGAQGHAPLRPGQLVALGGPGRRSTPNGKREFYTPAMAKRLGLAGPHERCRTCPEKAGVRVRARPGGQRRTSRRSTSTTSSTTATSATAASSGPTSTSRTR